MKSKHYKFIRKVNKIGTIVIYPYSDNVIFYDAIKYGKEGYQTLSMQTMKIRNYNTKVLVLEEFSLFMVASWEKFYKILFNNKILYIKKYDIKESKKFTKLSKQK